MDQSPNLGLPFVAPGQAQKHITHNEAVALLDAVVQLAVESRDLAAPPGSPAEGARYIVGASPSGAWAGHDGDIAVFADGGWTFIEAVPGMRAWLRDDGEMVVWSGAAWQRLADALGAFDLLGINATATTANRLSLASPGSLFNHEGGSHRLVINKQNAADTASLIFQRGFSGRAEYGLTGDDDFRVKVSSDGSAWNTALTVARASGRVTANSGLSAAGHILQVRSGKLTTAFTTTADTPQATGLSATITPTAASSKVLVRAVVHVGAAYWFTSPRLSLARGGTKIFPSTSGVAVAHQLLADTESNSRLVSQVAVLECVDEPASTSALTYSVQMSSNLGGYNVHINRREFNAEVRGESSIVVMEIGG